MGPALLSIKYPLAHTALPDFGTPRAGIRGLAARLPGSLRATPGGL